MMAKVARRKTGNAEKEPNTKGDGDAVSIHADYHGTNGVRRGMGRKKAC